MDGILASLPDLTEARNHWLWALVSVAVLMGFVLVSAIFFVWLERKVSGRIQDRLGPTRVGGKFGWLQTIADGIKLLCKEDTIPAAADHFLFRLAPYLALAGTFAAFLALPFGNGLVGRELGIAVFFILAALSTEVFGVIMAGYGSGSKWALFGGIRESAQVVSYEVPRSLCVIVGLIVAGSLNLTEVIRQQEGFFWRWHLFHDPFNFVACCVFFICGMSSCKRAPFDLAEAESELVAGFHTEYSGFRWLLFFMAEYGSMFAISALAASLWLGGWHCGLLPVDPAVGLATQLGSSTDPSWLGWLLGNVVNVTVFILKGWVGVFIMMWVRWTLPRLRIDQVMMTCLKYLTPIACFLLLAVAIWELTLNRQSIVANAWRYGSAGLFAAAMLWWLVTLWRTPSQAPPGVTGWARTPPPMPGELVAAR